MQAGKKSRLALVEDLVGAPFFALLHQAFELALHCDQVVEQELTVHGGDVTQRVHAPGGMGHIRVRETADDMDEPVHLGQLVQQLTGNARPG